MEIISPAGLTYEIGDLVANNEKYRLRLCRQEETGRQCLLQIATEAGHNGVLDRNAFFLKELDRRALEIENEYASIDGNQGKVLNYNLGFPELVDSFIYADQGDRRVNILAFRNVPEVDQMVPIINITEKDQLRIDLRTSAWIMGKLLKLLVFVHGEKITGIPITSKNILIEPDEHYVLIFDLSVAQIFPGGIPDEVCRGEISAAAEIVITACGGDSETGFFPNDGDEGFDGYTRHLLKLASGSERSAQRAHQEFYELVDGIWERGFHPFTTYPLA